MWATQRFDILLTSPIILMKSLVLVFEIKFIPHMTTIIHMTISFVYTHTYQYLYISRIWFELQAIFVYKKRGNEQEALFVSRWVDAPNEGFLNERILTAHTPYCRHDIWWTCLFSGFLSCRNVHHLLKDFDQY